MSRRVVLASTLGVLLDGCGERPRRARRLLGGLARASFSPEKPRALGPFDEDDALFERKQKPEPGDWLAEHAESYQSYRAYVALGPVRPTTTRSSIVLQPLGAFSPLARQILGAVREHASLFFSMDVSIADGMPLPTAGRRMRGKGERHSWQQHHAGTILKELSMHLPANAVAYLGVTEADLYPEKSWNFVFGEATLTERVGAYSLARFLPPFADVRTPEDFARALRRSVQLLAHETGHAFSLPHCVRFECVMNGSNSLAESDRAPIELCPDCLRKLAYALGFEPLARYRALGSFFARSGLGAESVWIARRLARLA